MQRIEQVFLREVVHMCCVTLGFKKLTELQAELQKRHIDPDDAKAYVYSGAIASKLPTITEVVLPLVVAKRDELIQALVDANEIGASIYLRSILDRHQPQEIPKEERKPIAATLAGKWLHSHARGNGAFKTGVYQLFRRYKPHKRPNEEGLPPDDVIVTELFFADSETLETVLVTSEGTLYWGSLHINHRSILYGLMQRPHHYSNDNQPVSIRFYAVNIKQFGGKQRPPYSGLYIKTGDRSELPLSGDCIFVHIPETHHGALHERMRSYLHEPFAERDVSADKVVMDYISGFDEDASDAAQTALRISDLPFIDNLLNDTPDRDPLFRPPTRALASNIIHERASGTPLPIFRRSAADEEPTLL
ncbi:MAG: hypothetical protein ABI471_02125 [Sphingomonas bacterium]